jgi:hypothetical protein
LGKVDPTATGPYGRAGGQSQLIPVLLKEEFFLVGLDRS